MTKMNLDKPEKPIIDPLLRRAARKDIQISLEAIAKNSMAKAALSMKLIESHLVLGEFREAERIARELSENEKFSARVRLIGWDKLGKYFQARLKEGKQFLWGYPTFEQAYRAFNEIAKREPSQGNLLLGQLYEDAGNKRKAIQSYDIAIVSHGSEQEKRDAEENLRRLLTEPGAKRKLQIEIEPTSVDPDEARKKTEGYLYEKLIELKRLSDVDFKKGGLYSDIVSIYLRLERFEEAEQAAEEATKLGWGTEAWRRYAEFFGYKSLTRPELGNRRSLEEALVGFSKVAEIDPALGNCLLGELFALRRSYVAAKRHYLLAMKSRGSEEYVTQAKEALIKLLK